MIYSKNKLEHQEYIHKVLQRLRQARLQADIKKSEFSIKYIKYLGFIISIDKIKIDPEKIVVIN